MTEIDPATAALVLVDLQERIVALPTTPYRGEDVVANALRLRDAFRDAGAPVVIVKVSRPDNPPGNELVFDAMTALSEISHENAITKIFPRLGTVMTTDEVLA
ncbi:isochorismatase family protein [Amycolatopsis solani]|uniref:isochorismatase family protein n=1 Tax=Amycolatopsis solani TaxID=3028615 RepID=UPI0025B22674|nr:isochorismatase family protein [Amycolatopsis sp. MEP2-6]